MLKDLQSLKRLRRCAMRVRLNPGDVVVFKLKGNRSVDVFKSVHTFVSKYFPNNEVLILDEGVADISVMAKGK